MTIPCGQNFVSTSHLFHACHTTRPSYPDLRELDIWDTSPFCMSDQILTTFTYFNTLHNLRIQYCCSMFHRLGPLACSDSALTSETMKPSRHFGRTPWMGDRPVSNPLHTQDSKNTDIYQCF